MRVCDCHGYSSTLAKVIFEVAIQNGFGDGYAWFVTEDVMRGVTRCGGKSSTRQSPASSNTSLRPLDTLSISRPRSTVDFSSYPAGLVGVATTMTRLKPKQLMTDVVSLVAKGLRQYTAKRRQQQYPANVESSSFSGGCWGSRQRYFPNGDAFYR